MRDHPIVKGIAAVAAFVLIAKVLVWSMPPAWAAIAIPISDHITINFGDLSDFVIAVGVVIGLWKAWKAEKAAVAIKTDLGAVKDDMKLIERNTNSMTTKIAQLAEAKGVVIGEAKGVAAGEEKAATLAEGQRQGRESASGPLASAAGDPPVPVVDDKVADAIKQSAVATEHVAAAAKDK